MMYSYGVLRLFFLIAGFLIVGLIGFIIWGRYKEISTVSQQTTSSSSVISPPSASQKQTEHLLLPSQSSSGQAQESPQQTRSLPLNPTHQKQLESHKGKIKKELTDMSRACIINMTNKSKKVPTEGATVDLNKWPDMASSCQPDSAGLKRSTEHGKTSARRHCTEKLVPLYCQTFGETSDHQHICMTQLKHECTQE